MLRLGEVDLLTELFSQRLLDFLTEEFQDLALVRQQRRILGMPWS